jgi:hypothetical protein
MKMNKDLIDYVCKAFNNNVGEAVLNNDADGFVVVLNYPDDKIDYNVIKKIPAKNIIMIPQTESSSRSIHVKVHLNANEYPKELTTDRLTLMDDRTDAEITFTPVPNPSIQMNDAEQLWLDSFCTKFMKLLPIQENTLKVDRSAVDHQLFVTGLVIHEIALTDLKQIVDAYIKSVHIQITSDHKLEVKVTSLLRNNNKKRSREFL